MAYVEPKMVLIFDKVFNTYFKCENGIINENSCKRKQSTYTAEKIKNIDILKPLMLKFYNNNNNNKWDFKKWIDYNSWKKAVDELENQIYIMYKKEQNGWFNGLLGNSEKGDLQLLQTYLNNILYLQPNDKTNDKKVQGGRKIRSTRRTSRMSGNRRRRRSTTGHRRRSLHQTRRRHRPKF